MKDYFPQCTDTREIYTPDKENLIIAVVTEDYPKRKIQVEFYFDNWDDSEQNFLYQKCDLEKEFGKDFMYETLYDLAHDFEMEITD